LNIEGAEHVLGPLYVQRPGSVAYLPPWRPL